MRRQIARSYWRHNLEKSAMSLAGYSLTPPRPSAGSKGGGGDNSDDPEGWGEPPEAKQLMEELTGKAAGRAATEPTGLGAVFAQVAVGVIAIVGEAVSVGGNTADRLLLQLPCSTPRPYCIVVACPMPYSVPLPGCACGAWLARDLAGFQGQTRRLIKEGAGV